MRSLLVSLAVSIVFLVGCQTEPPRPTSDDTVAEPTGSDVREGRPVTAPAEEHAPADDSSSRPSVQKDATRHRIGWRLPAGTSLRYLCKATVSAGGPMQVEGTISITVDIVAPREGRALVDTALSEFAIKMKGRDMPSQGVAQSYKVQALLDADEGFDPSGALARGQLNLLKMLFPLPEDAVAVGDEWPLQVQVLGLGAGAKGTEESVASLKEVADEDGSRLAYIDLKSEASAKMNAPEPMAMGMSVTGSATFDLSAGHFTTIDMTTSMSMPVPPTKSGNAEMKSSLKMVLKESSMLKQEDVETLSQKLATRQAVNDSVALAKNRKLGEALAVILGVIETDVHGEHAALIAAQIYSMQQKWVLAAEAIEKELGRSPENTQVLLTASQIYEKAGMPDKAAEVRGRMQKTMNRGSSGPRTP